MSEGGGKASGSKVAGEDEVGRKWDRCFSDLLFKTGAGAGLGIVFSLVLFKRNLWPVHLGTGIGLGFASSNCQHDFRRVQSVYLKPIKDKPVAGSTATTPDVAGTNTEPKKPAVEPEKPAVEPESSPSNQITPSK